MTNNGPSAAVLTLAPAGGSATFSGVIQDGASQTALTLNGPGTQILAGSNTYSGLTTITAGTLQTRQRRRQRLDQRHQRRGQQRRSGLQSLGQCDLYEEH